MIGIVIVAHGGLAEEYLKAVEHVIGPQDRFRAISVAAVCDRSGKEAEICAAVDSVDTGDGVVVVTDIFGGSPSNLSMCACAPDNRAIFYGANLPALIKLARSRRKPLCEALALAKAAGMRYMDVVPGSITWGATFAGSSRLMPTQILKIVNEKGLHARASARFVETVERFDARATVARDGLEATGDSIMGLLMLAAARGTEIEVTTEGVDADPLMEALATLVSDFFGEGM